MRVIEVVVSDAVASTLTVLGTDQGRSSAEVLALLAMRVHEQAQTEHATKVLAHHFTGKSARAIADATGYTVRAVRVKLRALTLSPNRENRDDRATIVLRMHRRKATTPAIAAAINETNEATLRLMRGLGLKPNRRKSA